MRGETQTKAKAEHVCGVRLLLLYQVRLVASAATHALLGSWPVDAERGKGVDA